MLLAEKFNFLTLSVKLLLPFVSFVLVGLLLAAQHVLDAGNSQRAASREQAPFDQPRAMALEHRFNLLDSSFTPATEYMIQDDVLYSGRDSLKFKGRRVAGPSGRAEWSTTSWDASECTSRTRRRDQTSQLEQQPAPASESRRKQRDTGNQTR